jgi:hypothetical protein
VRGDLEGRAIALPGACAVRRESWGFFILRKILKIIRFHFFLRNAWFGLKNGRSESVIDEGNQIKAELSKFLFQRWQELK